jgi:hypothetical protein
MCIKDVDVLKVTSGGDLKMGGEKVYNYLHVAIFLNVGLWHGK